MTPPVLLLLLLLLLSAGSLPPPRLSFLLNSADRPLAHFAVHNVSSLLLSADGSTLYVGARDAVLSLDVSRSDVISLNRKVVWRPSDSEISKCTGKGKNETVDCPNFVQVLQPLNSTHLYACGSYAFSPRDAYIDTATFSLVRSGGAKAKARCPFSPFERNAAITVDGELFTATTTDFRGVNPEISRHFSKDGRPDVSQDSSVSLLEEPTFVAAASDESDRKLYFFFTEVGKEFSFIEELKIGRVAQVCKDDVGGQRTLQKRWTSFTKAAFLCRRHKQLPFSVLQDVFTLRPPGAAHSLFYAVFTPQWPSPPQSAVCVFTLQDVRAAFAGSYRAFDTQSRRWGPAGGGHPYLGKCGLGGASDSQLTEVKRSFLAGDAVAPLGGGPALVSSQRYSRVAAMTVQQHTVLFLLTESGFVHKVVLLEGGAHLVEEIQVFTEPQQVKSLVLAPSKGLLFVGTSQGVTGVPVARCSVYTTCSQCVLARDPLCGWSRINRICTAVDGSHQDLSQDVDGVSRVQHQCPADSSSSRLVTEVVVSLTETVRLACRSPSALSRLSWSSPRYERLPPPPLFLQAADGSLSFLAAAATLGTYRCHAEERGHRELLAAYRVRLDAFKDESEEEEQGEEPAGSPTPPAGGGEVLTTVLKDESDNRAAEEEEEEAATTTAAAEEEAEATATTTAAAEEEELATSSADRRSWKEPLGDAPLAEGRSFHSELVVVSLLLAACVCLLILCGIHMGIQRRSGAKLPPASSPEDGSHTDPSMESVPSLSAAATHDPLCPHPAE